MADEKKPRKLKDLRARLGKTMAGTAAPSGNVVPPPNVGANQAAPVPPGLANPAAPRMKGNPFAPKPKAAERSADPFAASAPTEGPREVRLVVDEAPVEDAEIGRRRKGVAVALVVAGLVVGLGVSFALSRVNEQSINWNRGVRAAKGLYQSVQATSERMGEAQIQLDALIAAAKGTPTQTPSVNYDALTALLALPNPTKENTVHLSQNYSLLAPATVGPVQSYYQQVAAFWQRLDTLRIRTSEKRRAQLNESATASKTVAEPIGCVPAVVNNRFVCSLRFLFIGEDGVKVGPKRTTSEQNREAKQVFTGEGTGLASAPSDFVIILNNEDSLGVLGQQAREFAQYQQLLLEMQQLAEKSTELQGQVESSLGPVAAYEERFALFDSSSSDGDADGH